MCDFLPRGGTCYILLDYIILPGWDFFRFTGTGTVRWRAEGAGLGSQSELSPELMSPPRKRRRRRRSWLAKRADTSYHKILYGYRYRYTGTLTATTVHTGFWNPDDC